MRKKLILAYFFTTLGISFHSYGAEEDFDKGVCLAFTQYLNKMDAKTSLNSRFIAKYQPRLNSAMSSIGSCMKGKVDTPQQAKICSQSTLSKADYDFHRGWIFNIMKIDTNNPNIAQIKSNFSQYCAGIVN